MKTILIFGGTTEGRQLAEMLAKDTNMQITVCVATEYGACLLPENMENLKIRQGRLSEIEIETLLQNNFDFVVDCTHPYAVEITENILLATKNKHTKYLRLLRNASDLENIYSVETISQAAEKLEQTNGNILLTTGSKELEAFTKINNFSERIFPRVLPTVEAIEKCERLGFKRSNIIAMQGPFSQALNTAIISQFKIKMLVTKDGGKQGGFTEKISSAIESGIQVIVIGRPTEEYGFSLEEIMGILQSDRS